MLNNKRFLNENRESKNISLARRFWTERGYTHQQAQETVDAIRHDIPNSRLADCKFLLGVSRMYANGDLSDAQTIQKLNKTLKFVASGTHVGEYNNDLNGMSADDIIERFTTVSTEELSTDMERSSKREFTGGSSYKIVRIPDFYEASKYSRYTEWCVTKEQENYDAYTGGGYGIFYFCLRDGFENVPKEKGEGCPLDEYGLSMIAVSVNPDGSCNTVTCRWNHDNGGNDDIMTVEQLETVLNVNFYQTFKPRTPEEIKSSFMQKAEYVLSYLNDEVGENERETMDRYDIGGRKLLVWNGQNGYYEADLQYSVILEEADNGLVLAYDYAFKEEIFNLVPTGEMKTGYAVVTGIWSEHIFNTDKMEYPGGTPDDSNVETINGELCQIALRGNKIVCVNLQGEKVYESQSKSGLLNVTTKEPYLYETGKAEKGPVYAMYQVDDLHVKLVDLRNGKFIETVYTYGSDNAAIPPIALLTGQDGKVWMFAGPNSKPCELNPIDEYYGLYIGYGRYKRHVDMMIFRKGENYYAWELGNGVDTVYKAPYDELKYYLSRSAYYSEHYGKNTKLEEDVSIKPFEPKDALHPKFWINNKLNSKVRLRLLDIADDFVKTLDVRWVKPDDIVLTGSIANYNWNKFSDVDIHIIMDYKKVYNKPDFVKGYFDAKKEEWNSSHEGLKIYGFNVEMSVEDLNKPASSSGVYSLESNEWVKEPKDLSDAKLNKEYVERTAEEYIDKIDKLEEKLRKEKDAKKVELLTDKMVAIFDKLKGMRKEGLKTKAKEMSSGNIIWKILRAEGYIKKIWDAVNYNYDKTMSLNEGYWGVLPLENDYVLDDLDGIFYDEISKLTKKLDGKLKSDSKEKSNDIIELINQIMYLIWSSVEFSERGVEKRTGLNIKETLLKGVESLLGDDEWLDSWKDRHEIETHLKSLPHKIEKLVENHRDEETGGELGFMFEAVTGKDNKKASALYVYAMDGKNGGWCVLCAKRADRKGDEEAGKWNPPMGHVHRGESMLEGALRECLEESGVDFSSYKGNIKLMDTHRWGNNYRLVLRGKHTEDFKTGKGDEENEKFIWLPVSKIGKKEWAWSCGKNAEKFAPKTVIVNESQIFSATYLTPFPNSF